MTIKEIRERTGLSQARFAVKYNIPVKTIQNWEIDRYAAPEYVIDMLKRIVALEKIELKAWIFEQCSDSKGYGHYELFKTSEEAIEFARKLWNRMSPREKMEYDAAAGDWFLVAEVPVEWDDQEEDYEPILTDLDPVWSAI